MENLYNIKIATNASMSADVESEVIDLSKTNGYCIYANFTGTPVGSIKLQVSIDAINYVDLINSSTAIAAAGDIMWEVTNAFYDKVKVVYTRTSGTGVLNVQINGKGDNE